MNTITVLNPDDKGYFSRCYHVQLGYYLSFNGIIYASCEQDAIDILIDQCDNDDHSGKYMSFGYDQLRIAELSELELQTLLDSIKE